MFDPAGRRFAFEYAPPYEERPNFGVDRFGYGSDYGGVVIAVSTTGLEKTTVSLEAETAWIVGFSPSGRRLAYLTYRDGQVSLKIYDFERRRRVTLPHAPYDQPISPTIVWVSDDHVAYAALPAGRQPFQASAREYSGERLIQEWRRAWDGQTSTASEVTSRAAVSSFSGRDGALYLGDARTGRAMILASGLFTDLRLSANRRYLAALRLGPPVQPRAHALFDDWNLSRTQVALIDLQHPQVATPIGEELDAFPGTLTWSGDGRHFAFFAWPVGETPRTGMFYAHDTEDGTTDVWRHAGLDLASERERGMQQRPERAAWVGNRLAVYARPTSQEAPQFTYRGIGEIAAVGRVARADWFLLDRGGLALNLTRGFDAVSAVPLGGDDSAMLTLADGRVQRLSADASPVSDPQPGNSLTLTIALQYNRTRTDFGSAIPLLSQVGASHFAEIRSSTTGSLVGSLAFPEGNSELLASSPNGQAALFRRDSDRGTELILARSESPYALIRTLNRHLAEVQAPSWRVLSYSGPSNEQLQACALLPPNYDASRRYPTIVDIYPGTDAPQCLDATRAAYYRVTGPPMLSYRQLLAARGYIVLLVSNPRRLNRTPEGPIRGMTNVVLAGVDAAISQGLVDPDRVGLIGYSQGGFSALWLATQTDRFRPVVSMFGWADIWRQYFDGGYQHYFFPDDAPYIGAATFYESDQNSDFGLGATPWQSSTSYVENSPIAYAPNISSPILLLHSDMDVFLLGQYEAMFTALYRLRKDARFVRYWGEGHTLSSPANIRDAWTRIFAFFDSEMGANPSHSQEPQPSN